MLDLLNSAMRADVRGTDCVLPVENACRHPAVTQRPCSYEVQRSVFTPYGVTPGLQRTLNPSDRIRVENPSSEQAAAPRVPRLVFPPGPP